MVKTDEMVQQLLEIVKQAIEDGRATHLDVEEWLLAAIALEELALEEERSPANAKLRRSDINAVTKTTVTLH